ncbi:MAG TPA: hypothetical protein VN345_01425 [Blastocatellia bacterium]|jgi:hypothetical protein|nr:hypothetical protein [Blastocatellia bacterium]
MTDWFNEKLTLKKGHGWKAPAGYRIFVADRGAVRFNIPQGWIIEPDSDSIKFYDGKPPDDNCRLACSYFRLPPIDWSGLRLSELIKTATEGDERKLAICGDIVEQRRPDLELAWVDLSFDDPEEHRLAYSRICIARGSDIQTLITLDYWPEDGARLAPMWRELLRSLQLGRYVDDPTVGDVVN